MKKKNKKYIPRAELKCSLAHDRWEIVIYRSDALFDIDTFKYDSKEQATDLFRKFISNNLWMTLWYLGRW